MVGGKIMIVCNECGNELNETAKFCKKCGAKADPENVKAVEKMESANVEETSVEATTAVVAEETSTQGSTLDVDTIETRFFNYLDFLKETIIHPSSVFKQETTNWVFGGISLLIFSIILSYNGYYEFLQVFIRTVISQAAVAGLLFGLNKFLLGGKDTYLDAVGKYGGLMNSQILLLLLVSLLGLDSTLGVFLGLVIIVNQLNIFNLYVMNSQNEVNHKLDKYYQLLISYVPLIFAIIYMFDNIIAPW